MTTTRPLVVDSSAIIAYINGESGSDMIHDALASRHSWGLYLHKLNACEVAYKLIRAGVPGPQALLMATMPDWFTLSSVINWQRAAVLKAHCRHLSLADCVCIALAESIDADVLTGDRLFQEAGSTANILLFR